MCRPIRFIPEGGALVEVTCRTIHSRLLLRPSKALNELVLGVLGRAQRLRPVHCCSVVFASNHFHLLLWVEDMEQLAKFMEYANGNLARKVGRLVGWRDKIWSRRYQAIVISDEEPAQVARLRYHLAHGVKEGLVSRVRDWPGVHMVRALLDGELLKGIWHNRTEEYADRQQGKDFPASKYRQEEELKLTPLPCWQHLSVDQVRARVADLVEDVEQEAAAARAEQGLPVFGAEAVLRQHPHSCPLRTKRSPAPLFHAATKAAREALRKAYYDFVEAFRGAAETWKKGNLKARFPVGSFPPRPPFVRELLRAGPA
jgi:REP element-mobilizing transposase RayT